MNLDHDELYGGEDSLLIKRGGGCDLPRRNMPPKLPSYGCTPSQTFNIQRAALIVDIPVSAMAEEDTAAFDALEREATEFSKVRSINRYAVEVILQLS